MKNFYLNEFYTCQEFMDRDIVNEKKDLNDDELIIKFTVYEDDDKEISILVDGHHTLQAAIETGRLEEVVAEYCPPQYKTLEDYVSAFGELSNPVNIETGEELW